MLYEALGGATGRIGRRRRGGVTRGATSAGGYGDREQVRILHDALWEVVRRIATCGS